MKIYAFVRSNVPRVLRSRSPVKSENSSNIWKQKSHEKSSKISGESPLSPHDNKGDNQETEVVTSRTTASSPSLVHRKRAGESEIFNDESEQVKNCTGSSCDFRRDNNNIEEMSSDELNAWNPLHNDKGSCPSYSKYLYFYVAPTLIYKDNYPRYFLSFWRYRIRKWIQSSRITVRHGYCSWETKIINHSMLGLASSKEPEHLFH